MRPFKQDSQRTNRQKPVVAQGRPPVAWATRRIGKAPFGGLGPLPRKLDPPPQWHFSLPDPEASPTVPPTTMLPHPGARHEIDEGTAGATWAPDRALES